MGRWWRRGGSGPETDARDDGGRSGFDVDVCGHGLGLTLRQPFVFGPMPPGPALKPDANAVLVAHLLSDEVKNLIMVPVGDHAAGIDPLPSQRIGDVMVGRGGNVATLDEVATPADPLDLPEWAVRTARFGFLMPPTRILSGDDRTRALEIAVPGGGPDELLWLRGPWPYEEAPRLPELLTSDQRIVDGGDTGRVIWAEVAYEHDGEQWRQWHHYRMFDEEVVLVSGQSLAERADQTNALCEFVVETLWLR